MSGEDVSDLFDAFHRVATCLWHEFGRELGGEDDGVAFDDLVDALEVDVFLPACARRARATLGLVIDPDDVAAHILLVDATGHIAEGGAGRYHSHAFHPVHEDEPPPAAVLAGNLLPRPRTEVALLLVTDPPGRGGGGARGRALPVR